jgi:uncharacterized protein
VSLRTAGLVADLWRYPVKSFGGERVREIFVGPFGFQGDRRFAAVAADGAVLTARRTSSLLGFRARFPDSERLDRPVVTAPDGSELAVDDPRLGVLVGDAVGRDAQMAQSGAGVFDAAPIHIVTDRSLRMVDEWAGQQLDVARFRPNVVIELDRDHDAFCESDWVGRDIGLGQAVVRIVSPTERCVVTTIDPDTLDRDRVVLSELAVRRDNLFGVYGQVVCPGWVRIGDPVVVRPSADPSPPSPGTPAH